MDSSLKIIHFTVSEVLDTTVGKAGGIDDIAPSVLRSRVRALVVPLHHTSLQSGNKISLKNNHPILLLCNASKVLEGLMYDKVISKMANTIILYQFGFQKNTSTQ